MMDSSQSHVWSEGKYTGHFHSNGGPAYQGDQNAGNDINHYRNTYILNHLPASLAGDVYHACLFSSEGLEGLSGYVAGLHAVLREISDSCCQRDLTPDQQDRLEVLSNGCHDGLSRLQRLQASYESMDLKTQAGWHRIPVVAYQLAEIRDHLTRHTGFLSMFLRSLIMSSHAGLEKVVVKFMNEVRQGYHEGSATSRLTNRGCRPVVSEYEEHEIRKDLEEFGITEDQFRQHRDLIMATIRQVIQEDGSEQESLAYTVGRSLGAARPAPSTPPLRPEDSCSQIGSSDLSKAHMLHSGVPLSPPYSPPVKSDTAPSATALENVPTRMAHERTSLSMSPHHEPYMSTSGRKTITSLAPIRKRTDSLSSPSSSGPSFIRSIGAQTG